MADLAYYVGEDGVDGHCDCMFLYNMARWNWTTIAALVCPRPLLFANSDNDRIFPMSANERVINRLERLYAHFEAGDRVEAVVSVGGHAYRRDLRRSVFEFFNRHLKQDARPVEDPDAGLGPDGKHRHAGKDLRVFPEDSDLPKDAVNARADEVFPVLSRPQPPGPCLARVSTDAAAVSDTGREQTGTRRRTAKGLPSAALRSDSSRERARQRRG